MDWKLLLSDERPGLTRAQASKKDGRSQFQKDFDRVVFSPAFRRLQDKTQVFPLPESDFVHTRLTHSLEVSVVGRSLGNLVGEKVIERNHSLQNDLTKFHFGEIVAAACLAHDIGNPPFGHPGEDAIADYFRNGNGKKYKSEISDEKKWNDLIKYEGNAQGFRIITKLQNPDLSGGLRLTFATLAAFTKYPNESFIAKREVEVKKFGFFQAEKDIFKKIAESCSLDCKKHKDYHWWCRHPLTFLVEAADDICYRIMDLEDGYRLGLVSFKETEELLFPLLTDKKLAGYKNRDEREKIGFLRAKAISDLVKDLAAAFLENEKNILNGKLEKDLISMIRKSKPLQEIYSQSISKIYRSRVVVEREVAGYEVLGGLLDTFINAFNQYVEGDLSPRNRSVINLLPSRLIASPDVKQLELYERLLRIIDFISGMTDSFAVSLFRKIKGISLPGGRVTE